MVLNKIQFHSAVFFLFLLMLWFGVTSLGWIDPIILPTPVSVLRALPEMFRDDHLVLDLIITLGRVTAAVALASLFGVSLGLLFGYKRSIYSVVEAPLHALRSVPASALFPLFLLVIGVGDGSIVALATYPSLLIILLNAASGAFFSNKRRLYQAKLLGLSAWDIITEFLFFEALPNIITGIRTAVSYSLVLVIAVEMFIGIGAHGLGRKIYLFQSTYQIPKTYAAIGLAALVGIFANLVLNAIEGRIARWLPHVHS